MKVLFLKYYPLLCGIIFLLLTYFILLEISYYQNEQHIVYSLDDAYIHMAMAKNMAISGVWGISQYEFASSSSSIIWTLLLSFIYYFIGPNELTPLFMNVLFGTLVIFSSYQILKSYKISSSNILIILISLTLITPLPPLMFTGLEHVLHIWVSLLFIYFVSRELTAITEVRNNYLWLLVISAMLPAIRYEGVFLILIASVLFLIRGKWLKGIAILGISLLPIFIFGLISINNGWSFFPNSLMLKAGFPDVTSFSEFVSFIGVIVNIFLPVKMQYFMIIFLILFSSVIYYFRKRIAILLNLSITYLIILFTANIFLYAAYSKSGWSYRYQSFLVALGIVVVSILFLNYILKDFRNHILLKSVLTVLIIIIPFVYILVSGIQLIVSTPRATTNIYEQQYQMGQFIGKYYKGKGVTLNDIGTSNYFGDINCLELWGLGNIEISKLRRERQFNENNIREISDKYHVVIAVVYDSWFSEGDSTILPTEWIKAGEWKISDNVIAGDDVVSFYAVNSYEETILIENLRQFSKLLPVTVKQSGKYTRN